MTVHTAGSVHDSFGYAAVHVDEVFIRLDDGRKQLSGTASSRSSALEAASGRVRAQLGFRYMPVDAVGGGTQVGCGGRVGEASCPLGRVRSGR